MIKETVLLNLLAKELFGFECEINLDDIDFKELYNEARTQTVIGIAFNALPKNAPEKDVDTYLLWQQTTFAIIRQTLNNNFANVQLNELLKQNEIKHATIKGYSSAYYYPEPNLRQMGDIDFLIDKSDVDVASKILLDNGFVNGHEANELHIDFKKNKLSYEMHTEVTTVPIGKEFVLKTFDDLIDKAVEVDSACGKITIPCEYHHGVTMLTHMQRHMTNGSGIGLRHLCDWAVFVNAIDNDSWIEIFETKLKNIGLWQFARVISKSASIYIKMPTKSWFSDVDDELAKSLIDYIFESGNFGRKNNTRSMQRVFSDGNGKNKILRILSGTKKWVYIKYPICEKYKVLFPAFYVIHFIKVLFKAIFKTTDYNFSDAYKKGNKQFDT